jgi:hypothetical protein
MNPISTASLHYTKLVPTSIFGISTIGAHSAQQLCAATSKHSTFFLLSAHDSGGWTALGFSIVGLEGDGWGYDAGILDAPLSVGADTNIPQTFSGPTP